LGKAQLHACVTAEKKAGEMIVEERETLDLQLC
jgi:hypothetical protein